MVLSKLVRHFSSFIFFVFVIGGSLFVISTFFISANGNNKISNTSLLENSQNLYINDTTEFVEFIQSINAGNDYAGISVLLNEDIDLENISPADYACTETFAGVFDGQGKSIKNYAFISNARNIGLFSTLTGEVRNLNFESNLVLDNTFTGIKYIGSIAGNIEGEFAIIENCQINFDITTSTDLELNNRTRLYIGGVCGQGDDISNIEFIKDVSITGNWSALPEMLSGNESKLYYAPIINYFEIQIILNKVYVDLSGVNENSFNLYPELMLGIDYTLTNSTIENFDANYFSNWYFDETVNKPVLSLFKIENEPEIPDIPPEPEIITITPVLLEDTFIYNNTEPTLSFAELNIDADIKIVANTQNCIDVGDYEIPLSLSGEGAENYELSVDYVTIHIIPYEITVVWDNNSLKYNGKEQLPKFTLNLPSFADENDFVVSGGGIEVDNYTASISTTNKNFTLKNATFNFKIIPAEIELQINNAISVYCEEIPTLTYKLISNESELDFIPVFSIENTTQISKLNVGEYKILVNNENKNVNVTYNTAILKIEPRTIYITVENLTGQYTGSSQIINYEVINILENDKVNVELDTTNIVNSGTYTLNFVINNNENNNYVLENKSFTFTVTPVEVSAVWGNSQLTFNGQNQVPSVVVDGLNTNEIQVSGGATNIGNYNASVISLNKNYLIINSTCAFEIKPYILEIKWFETELIFSNEYQLPKYEILNLPNFTDNLQIETSGQAKFVGDYIAMLLINNKNYLLSSSNCDFVIKPYEISIEWSNTTVTYDGFEKSPEIKFNSLENYPIEIEVPKFVNAGKYEIELEIDDKNIMLLNNTSTFIINKKSITINWGETIFKYKGIEQAPNAECAETAILVSGAMENVGTYTAIASANNNYEITNPQIEYTIKPYEIAINWESEDFVYNGKTQAPKYIYDLPEFANNLNIDLFGTGSNAGTYNCYLVLENDNYKLINDKFFYEIKPLEISIIWNKTDLVYNENYQKPEYVVTLPSFIPDLNLSLIGAGMNAGSYTAYLNIDNQDKNYKNITLLNNVCNYTISPKTISLEWTNKTFEYDGEVHIPEIICLNGEISKLNLKIQGGQTEVGEYTALAVCENTNYILENASCDFEITPKIINVECNEIKFTISTPNVVLDNEDVSISSIADFSESLPQDYSFFLGFNIAETYNGNSPSSKDKFLITIDLPENLILPSDVTLLDENLNELKWQIVGNTISFSSNNLGSIYFVYHSGSNISVSFIIYASVVLILIFFVILILYRKHKNRRIYFKELNE